MRSLVHLIFCLSLFLSCDESDEALITEVTINTDFNVPFVPIQVQGETVWFLLDTGAPGTIIDLDLALEWGLEMGDSAPKNQVNGVVMESEIDGFNFKLNDQQIHLDRARTSPLKRIGLMSFMGKDFGGILGYNFIRDYVFEIDYLNSFMRIYDKEKYTYQGQGEIIDANITSTRPLINGRVFHAGKNVPVSWLIDTGSLMFLSLNGPLVDQYGLTSELKTIPSMSVGSGGTGDAVMYKLDSAEIAGVNFDAPISAHSSSRISSLFEGVVGGELLSRFKIILDYKNDRVIFEPNEKLNNPIRFDLSGMILRTNGAEHNEVFVAFVFKGSPAERQGIMSGDVIESINGKAAKQLTLPDIWKMFRENEGDTFNLIIKRRGAEMDKKIVLKDYLEE